MSATTQIEPRDRTQDALRVGQLAVLIVALHQRLGQARNTKAGSPVGHLANSDGRDTAVEAANTILLEDIVGDRKGRLAATILSEML